ncbi:MAG: hypothetical protein CMI62_16700 [Parvibaculum sp.]|jgi:glycosyltransferase involved in cell wall biosynthesis|uniref:glycosyltransferase n=1 Tax=Parvibaculum sp. TaxID=2024848 RepID=UPI000C49B55D|nr:glycosyltransferase [Parvibaculum sp.]MAU62362.1 hypothetical protein [Parvibaculum sp.]|tara:strand:- start:68236 stop:70692 length:2457 start_codon:yes stop_codon:yes gene_type:complete
MQPQKRKTGNDRALSGTAAAEAPLSEGESSSLADLVLASRFFKESWYLRSYPEVGTSGFDPLEHFLRRGASGDFDPGPLFSSKKYMEAHPELRETGENPLLHYLRFGIPRDRLADPDAFDSDLSARQRARDAGGMFMRRFGFVSDEAGKAGLVDAVNYLTEIEPVLLVGTESPDVSIVMQAGGRMEELLSLLDSLAWHETRWRCEIVVTDTALLPQERAVLLTRIPWIRTVCGSAVNDDLRGEYIVLLGGTTRVVTRWLDELIGSFSLFPAAGIVGPRILRNDLSLQQAGGIVLSGGAVRRYGFGKAPDHPRFSYARQTDFVSAASLAIRRNLWSRLGGFDTAVPVSHRAADLAFRARKAGFEVWYQPVSQVIACDEETFGEQATGKDEETERADIAAFHDRWRSVLRRHGDPATSAIEKANRYSGKPLVVFDRTTPAPDRDAGSHLAASLIHAYMQLGRRVVFTPPPNYKSRDYYTRDLQRLGVECLHKPHFGSVAEIAEYVKNVDHVLVFRVNVLGPLYDDIRAAWPDARIIYNTVDLHHLREARQAEIAQDEALSRKAAETEEKELSLIRKADCTVVLSETERELLLRSVPEAADSLVVFPYIFEMPERKNPPPLMSARRDIVFLGGYMHMPNIDAAHFLKEKIWPRLRPHLPADARLLLVGADAGPEIYALSGDGVEVTGFVADLEPVFDSARVFVAPLRFGAGIKGKVIHALAHGVPSVVSPIAAEGMGLVDERDLLVAEGEGAFCEAVLRLYGDEVLWEELHGNGLSFVERNYSWENGLDRCRTLLEVADRTAMRRKAAGSSVKVGKSAAMD